MSRVNFDILASRHPAASEHFKALEAWINNHSSVVFLDIPQVVHALPEMKPDEVSQAFQYLAEHYGVREYRLLTRDQGLLGSYPSIESIPEEVSDRFGIRTIPLEDCEVVPGIRLGELRGKS